MIYIASQTSNQNTAPAFKQRDITGYKSIRPSDISIQGIAHQKELAYAGYKESIDIFVSATSRQHKLLTTAPGARLTLTRPRIPCVPPPVLMIPRVALSADQADALEKKLAPMQPTRKEVGKKIAFLLAKPTFDNAINIFGASQDFQRPDPSYITPDAFLALSFLNAIATEFIATQTYPAWKDEDSKRSDEEIQSIMDMQFHISAAKRKVVETRHPVKKSRPDPKDSAGMEVEEEVVHQEVTYELKWESIRDSVLTAKPSPLPYQYNFGGPNDVPFLPGLVFPFFDRMMIPDNLTIRNILSRHFIRCFGDSRAEQQKTYKSIKGGLDSLTRTSVGLEYLHIFIGIELALDTQTRLFLVKVSDEYAGFVLLGARFSVLVDNEWHEAKSARELQKDVKLLSSHTASLHRVCEILSSLKIAAGDAESEPVTVNPDTISNGHDLWDAIAMRKTRDVVDELTSAMRGISFTRSFLSINPKNIQWALEMVSTKRNVPLSRDIPVYVPSAFNLLNERILRVLACFGPDSFSLQNQTGTKYQITSAARRDDPNEAMDVSGKEKVLPAVIVAVKGVVTCYQDMNRTIKESAITMNLQERAAKHRCHVFKGEERDLIYGKLRELVRHYAVSKDDGAVLGKRKADEQEAVVAGPSSAADLLAMF